MGEGFCFTERQTCRAAFGSVPKGSHSGRESGLYTQGTVFDDGAGPGVHPHGVGGIKKKTGVRLPVVAVVGAEDTAIKIWQEPGHPQADTHFVVRAVGGDTHGRGQFLKQRVNAIHGLELIFKCFRHPLSDCWKKPVGNGFSQPVTDQFQGISHFSARKILNRLVQGQVEPEFLCAIDDDGVSDPFAVHQGAITIEDNGFKPHRRSVDGFQIGVGQHQPLYSSIGKVDLHTSLVALALGLQDYALSEFAMNDPMTDP